MSKYLNRVVSTPLVFSIIIGTALIAGGVVIYQDSRQALEYSQPTIGLPPASKSSSELRLLSPNGGEKWKQWENYTVAWQGGEGVVRGELMGIDGSVGWIFELEDHNRVFEWKIGVVSRTLGSRGKFSASPGKYKIRIHDRTGRVDSSDDWFFITDEFRTPPVQKDSDWWGYRSDEYGLAFQYPYYSAEKSFFLQRAPYGYYTGDTVQPYYKSCVSIDCWTISRATRQKIAATLSCKPLKSEQHFTETFSPYHINLNRPNICRVYNHPQGPVIVYGVGIAWQFEGLYYRDSIILVLDENEAILIRGAVLPAYSEKTKNIAKDFTSKYADPVYFPSKEFLALDAIVSEAIEEEISTPFQEIKEAMENLEKMVQSFVFLQ